ncbi:MAG: type IX secretion system membrane protein PorP/SprF [Saprospiraceae bacterium]
MRKILFTFICALFAMTSFAQQEQHYTQFMYNKLAYNPGYAGSHETACVTGIIRSQWLGLEGAPNTQILSFNMPILNQRVGIGANLTRHTIGISQKLTLDAVYSYRIRLATGTLGLGVQASVRYFNNNFADSRLVSTVPIALDNSIPSGARSKYVPNFGAGAYFSNERFYVGASIPRLLGNNIDFNETGTILSEEKLHGYIMTGYLFDINENVSFKPQALLKFATNSPFDADVNASFIFNKKYIAGLTYRLGGSSNTAAGESLDIMVGAQISNHIFFGLSYDVTLSEIKDYSNGSIEGVVRYCIGKSEGEDIVNPRFF